ncbi:hypothetical protein GYMLUDRAFT_40144 [Collybiopsis luxurians FD-317 M1]|uniref:GTP-binding protein 2 n=1 Tax=Collybiopsis luxurians FD-317 M1 TaxID=944289 RepID=A0A0D0CW20_9AGAR|nr:hypothetical protein GYMLUDRAFT_40144 [Collybiopsis luxurians FD-317 M1]
MFGEDEPENSRVPSPWDNISTPPRGTPSWPTPSPSPSPLGTPANGTLISLPSSSDTPSRMPVALPRLPQESDNGNIEYKLQLLHPTPSRFTRLVTQLKWRLLEGNGQAYYELGVADSGLLVGLNRKDLDETLDTLEMMAGEIGASVIVVKEIEVERNLAEMAKREEDYRERRGRGKERYEDRGYSDATTTDTTDSDTTGADGIFAMDDPTESDENLNSPQSNPYSQTVDLGVEISAVFKPRPMTLRMQMSNPTATTNLNGQAAGNGGSKAHSGHKPRKKLKPPQHQTVDSGSTLDGFRDGNSAFGKIHNRRQARDRRRAEKRKALEALVESLPSTASPTDLGDNGDNHDLGVGDSERHGNINGPSAAESLATELESLHVSQVSAVSRDAEEHVETSLADSVATIRMDGPVSPVPIIEFTPVSMSDDEQEDPAEDDDVFPSPAPSANHARFQHLAGVGATPLDGASTTPQLDVDVSVEQMDSAADCAVYTGNEGGANEEDNGPRLIVEALVVRKLSLEESFLDFGGFGLELS